MTRQTLRILGRDYVVETVNRRTMKRRGFADSAGYVVFADRKIVICTPAIDADQTLLHEILEVLNYELELKLEHPKIKALENSLYQVLSDNKLVFHE